MLFHDTAIVFGRYARQTLRSRFQVLFGLLMPLLYLFFFGPLLRDLPLGSAADSWQILVPGLLIQLSLFGASFTGFAIIVEKSTGVVERMRVTPVSRAALLLGRVLRDALLFTFQAVLLVLAALLMGLRAPLAGILIGFAFTGVLALSLASLSYALAMRVSTPQEFGPVINAVTMPGHAALRADAAGHARPRLARPRLAPHPVPLSGGRGAGRLHRLVRHRAHAPRGPGRPRLRRSGRDGGHTGLPTGRSVTTLTPWSI